MKAISEFYLYSVLRRFPLVCLSSIHKTCWVIKTLLQQVLRTPSVTFTPVITSYIVPGKAMDPKRKCIFFGKRDHSDLEETARQHICFCGMKWDWKTKLHALLLSVSQLHIIFIKLIQSLPPAWIHMCPVYPSITSRKISLV